MPDDKELDSLRARMDAIRNAGVAAGDADTADAVETPPEQPQTAMPTMQKPVVSVEKVIGEAAERPEGPVGLDIGTSHIVVAQNRDNRIITVQDLNAFFTVPNAKFALDILDRKGIMYYEKDDLFYIVGASADSFAHMFHLETRRPMKEGLLSADESEGLSVINAVVGGLIQKPKTFGEVLCFGLPGEPLEGHGSIVYHEAIIKQSLRSLGYSPLSLNEGMAAVLTELSADDFTGIGISLGGGMCNVCLSYLSFPVITYSLQLGGDYIDTIVGRTVAEPATKIKTIKETELDFTKDAKDRITTALQIFYDELIFRLLESVQRVLAASDKIPKIAVPIPIVLSGGTAMPNGFKEKFEKTLKTINLPVDISSVRMAEDPLNTTAKGALIMAMTEAG